MKSARIAILLASLIVVGNVHGAFNYNATNPNSADGSWEINFYIPDSVTIDYFSPSYSGDIPNPGTKVNLMDGGSIQGQTVAYNNSNFSMNGGSMGGGLHTHDYSKATVNGGSVHYHLASYGNSKMCLNNGTIHMYVWAFDNSQIDISGGTVGYYVESKQSSNINITGGYGVNQGTKYLFAHDDSTITLKGITDYYGDLKDAPFSVWGYDNEGVGRWFGYLTGSYSNGDIFNLRYEIYDDASIIVIPEPTTLSLLALGGLLLRKRNKKSLI